MALDTGVAEEENDWVELGMRARELNNVCVGRLGRRYAGGWVGVGGDGDVGVVVRSGFVGFG